MASLTRRHGCKPYAEQDSAGQLKTHDGAADEENNQDDEHESRNRLLGSHFSQNKRVYLAAFRWWTDEYKCAVICALSIILLAILLWYYDGKIAPHISPGLELDMVVIALVTITRVAMGNIVEACISQCAWIWISKSHQLRTKTHARLEDFKLFDEASRGLLGSIALIWRMKGL